MPNVAYYITIAPYEIFCLPKQPHRGRKYNQDRVAYAYTDEALLLVLADGMGGTCTASLRQKLPLNLYAGFEQTAQPRVAAPEKFLAEPC